MIPGDFVMVNNYKFVYRGMVSTVTDVPHGQPGVYFIQKLRQYLLRHPTEFIDIVQSYSDYMIHQMVHSGPAVHERVSKEVFSNPINADDNYLKVLIKKILLKERIDIKDYRQRFINDNHMNNMKRLITGNSNLTYEKFIEWSEVLGYTHSIHLYDEHGDEFDHEHTITTEDDLDNT
jgi:hypothetical protein